jgi:hypothetical protein
MNDVCRGEQMVAVWFSRIFKFSCTKIVLKNTKKPLKIEKSKKTVNEKNIDPCWQRALAYI